MEERTSGQRDLCNSCGLRWAKKVSENMLDPDRNTGHLDSYQPYVLDDAFFPDLQQFHEDS